MDDAKLFGILKRYALGEELLHHHELWPIAMEAAYRIEALIKENGELRDRAERAERERDAAKLQKPKRGKCEDCKHSYDGGMRCEIPMAEREYPCCTKWELRRYDGMNDADAEFCANARSILPELLAEVERQGKERAERDARIVDALNLLDELRANYSVIDHDAYSQLWDAIEAIEAKEDEDNG